MLRRLGNVARTAGGNRTSRQRRRHSGGGSVRGSVGGSSSGGGGEGGEGGGSSSRAIVSAIAAAAHRRGLDLAVGLTLQDYNALVGPAMALPELSRSSTLAVLVGSTRDIWTPFLRALRQSPTRGHLAREEEHGGERREWCAQREGSAGLLCGGAHKEAAPTASVPTLAPVRQALSTRMSSGRRRSLLPRRCPAGLGSRCTLPMRPRRVGLLRCSASPTSLAQRTFTRGAGHSVAAGGRCVHTPARPGVAPRRCGLNVHPTFGPWHAYRSLVVVAADGLPRRGAHCSLAPLPRPWCRAVTRRGDRGAASQSEQQRGGRSS